MDTEIHNDDDGDDDFEAYHEKTAVGMPLAVRKPMGECMEQGGSYPTSLRQELATGETDDGTPYAIHMGVANARLEVSFGDSNGPVVEFQPQHAVGTAIRAVQTRGYDIDMDDEDDRALEVDERVGAVVADLAAIGCIPESEYVAVKEMLPPKAADYFEKQVE